MPRKEGARRGRKDRRLSSYLNDFGGQDIRDLTELFDHILVYRIVDEAKRQRLAALMLSAEVHTRDVHVALAKNASNSPDHAGLVVISEENHVAPWNDLERISVDVHDARKLVRKDRP